jgi:nucleoside-diphosphate kinase
MIERTLLNIKPDAVGKNLIGEIIKRVESKGYQILAIDKLCMTQKEAEVFYAIHRGKPFFKTLVRFMSSGPCVPIVVEGEGVIQGLRELIGDTDPSKAAPGTIRHCFAEDITKNSVHASDGEETAEKEIGFFFGQRGLIR